MTSIPVIISSSNNSQQAIADQEIKNPLDKIQYVNSIELVPDPAFQLKGILEITLNDARLFFSSQAGYFSRYRKFAVPMNFRKIDRQGKIKFYVWNGLSDSSPIAINGTVNISDKDIDLSSGSDTQTVPSASDAKVIFPFILRGIGTYTQQLDLAGYKKLLLLIAAASYKSPIVSLISSDSGVTVNNPLTNMSDGNLSTFTQFQAVIDDTVTKNALVKFDFGSVANRVAASSISLSGPGSNGGISLTVSQDDITYIAASGGIQSFRYIKAAITIKTTSISTQIINTNVNEVYDSDIFGGQAEVSFEALEISSNQWIEIVTAASIGTVSQGQAVAKQLGDTMALSNLNVIFVSNYAGLRMKLTILNGNIQTAVSIQRLA